MAHAVSRSRKDGTWAERSNKRAGRLRSEAGAMYGALPSGGAICGWGGGAVAGAAGLFTLPAGDALGGVVLMATIYAVRARRRRRRINRKDEMDFFFDCNCSLCLINFRLVSGIIAIIAGCRSQVEAQAGSPAKRSQSFTTYVTHHSNPRHFSRFCRNRRRLC